MKHAISALAFAMPAAATADPVCAPRAEMEASLVDWYEERPIEAMRDDRQLWASDAGTWTVLEYTSDGLACTVAHGQSLSPRSEVLAQLAVD